MGGLTGEARKKQVEAGRKEAARYKAEGSLPSGQSRPGQGRTPEQQRQEALAQAELHGITKDGKFTRSLSQQELQQLSPELQSEYNRQAQESQRQAEERKAAEQQEAEERKQQAAQQAARTEQAQRYTTKRVGGAIVPESLISADVKQRQELEYQYGSDKELAFEKKIADAGLVGTSTLEADIKQYESLVEQFKATGSTDEKLFEKLSAQYEKVSSGVEAENVARKKKYEDDLVKLAGGIVKEAKEKGATKIQIYSKEGIPIGSIKTEGAQEPLQYLLRGGEVQYSVFTPKTKEEREKTKKEYAELKGFVQEYKAKGVTLAILKEGEIVAEASKEKPLYDIYKATKKYGEVSVTPILPTKPPPEYKPGEASLNVLKSYAASFLAPKPIISDILGKTPHKEIGQYGEKVEGFLKPGSTLLGSTIEQLSSGKPLVGTGMSTAYDIESGIVEAALIATPFRKVPFVGVAKFGETKVLTVSLGSRVKEVASVTGGKVSKGFDIAKIGKEEFKKIAEDFSKRSKGGAEIDVLGGTEAKIMIKEKNLTKLQEAGILTEENVRLIKAGKTGVQESAKEPNKILRDLGAQPFENIKAGSETKATKEFFKEEKIVLEGSAIDIPTFPERFVGRAGDFDIKVKNALIAGQLAKKYASKLNPLLSKGTEFRIEGVESKQIVRYEDGKKIGKVGEFLSQEDPTTGQISRTGKVLGVKTDTGKMKVEGIKMKTGKFQISRRVASITSMQPTAKGIDISPPINIPGKGSSRAKDFPRAYAGLLSRAAVAKERGNIQRALRLEQAAKEIKIIGEKKIDFAKFFKSRRTLEFVQEEKPNVFEGISGISKVVTERPSSILSTQRFVGREPAIEKSPTSPDQESPSIIKQRVVDKSYGRLATKSSYRSATRSLSLKSRISPLSSLASRSLISSGRAFSQPSSILGSPSKVLPSTSPKSPVSPKSPRPLSLRTTPSPSRVSSKGSQPPSSLTLQTSKPEKMKLLIVEPPPEKKKVIITPFGGTRRIRREPGKPERGERAEFVGNVRLSELTGVYKRTEVTYDPKKISRYVREDKARDRKRFGLIVGKSARPQTKSNPFYPKSKKFRLRL